MDEDCVTLCSTTTTAMKCCICLDDVTPDKAYKFWECDWHYTCKQCGSSLKTCPLCRAPTGHYVSRPCTPNTSKRIREDWKEEAERRGLLQTSVSNIDNDNSVIIQSWTPHGRCLTLKAEAERRNIQDVRLSW